MKSLMFKLNLRFMTRTLVVCLAAAMVAMAGCPGKNQGSDEPKVSDGSDEEDDGTSIVLKYPNCGAVGTKATPAGYERVARLMTAGDKAEFEKACVQARVDNGKTCALAVKFKGLHCSENKDEDPEYCRDRAHDQCDYHATPKPMGKAKDGSHAHCMMDENSKNPTCVAVQDRTYQYNGCSSVLLLVHCDGTANPIVDADKSPLLCRWNNGVCEDRVTAKVPLTHVPIRLGLNRGGTNTFSSGKSVVFSPNAGITKFVLALRSAVAAAGIDIETDDRTLSWFKTGGVIDLSKWNAPWLPHMEVLSDFPAGGWANFKDRRFKEQADILDIAQLAVSEADIIDLPPVVALNVVLTGPLGDLAAALNKTELHITIVAVNDAGQRARALSAVKQEVINMRTRRDTFLTAP